MADLAAALPLLLLALLSAYGYGGVWLRLLRLPPQPEAMSRLYALAVGLGTLAYLVLAVGLAGLLRRPVLLGLLAVGWVLAGICLAEQRRLPRSKLEAKGPVDVREALIARLLWAVLGIFAAGSLIFAVRPPDGLEWDSLSYHLAAPKVYLQDGRIGLIAYDSHTDFPFTMQMLYTVGLAFGGAAAAKLFHWGAGWITALTIASWTPAICNLQFAIRNSQFPNARPNAPQWSGPAAALLFVGMPLVLWEMGTAYVDLGTAMFQLLALAALVTGVDWERRLADVRWAALAGILSGFAVGTKTTALIQFGVLGLGLLWLAARSGPKGWKPALTAAGVFGVLGVLVGCPWYVKSWVWVHNPVYPFYFKYFPHSFSWNAALERAYANEQKQFGVWTVLRPEGKAQFPDLGRLLWDLGMHARAFYITTPKTLVGDKLGSLGPVWAGILPLLLWTRRPGWKAWALLLYSGASILIWFMLSQQSRYLMPVFAPLAVAGAVILVRLPSRLLQLAAAAFCGTALLLTALVAEPLVETALPYALGQVSTAEYYARQEEPLYEVAQVANTLPPDSRIAFYEETRGFYFDRKYFWANPGQHDLIRYEELPDVNALVERLRQFGITHVLINYQFAAGKENTPYFRLLDQAMREGRLREITRSAGAVEGRRGVVLYEIR